MEKDDTSPGFYRFEFEPDNTERIVLRFPNADTVALPIEKGAAIFEFELRGPQDLLEGWRPGLHSVEGILVLTESEGPVRACDLKVHLPPAIRDLEIHSRTGDIEVKDLPIGVMAETESGNISVSGAISLEAISASGDMDIDGVGTAELRTGTGSLRCVNSRDIVVARSKSGDIDIEDAVGDLFLETGSGEISVARPRGRVRAASHAGDIEIEAPASFGGGEATSVSGRIGFILGGADLELRAETFSGKLRTPHGEVGSPAGPRRCALSVGRGGRRLHAKSVSGDIDIDY